MSSVSNHVNYGDPDEIIAFMIRGVEQGAIRKAVMNRIRIETLQGGGYKVAEVPAPHVIRSTGNTSHDLKHVVIAEILEFDCAQRQDPRERFPSP